MKRRFFSFFLLILFCFSNAGVVLGLHTCLKSQRTDFSVFPIQNQTCCGSGGVELENQGAFCPLPKGTYCAPELAEGSVNCCLYGQTDQGCTSAVKTVEKESVVQCIGEATVDCCGLSLDSDECIGGDCCRVDQVVLLDMHPRSLPKNILDFCSGIPWFVVHSIFQGVLFSRTENQLFAFSGGPFGISCTASEILQVWRL